MGRVLTRQTMPGTEDSEWQLIAKRFPRADSLESAPMKTFGARRSQWLKGPLQSLPVA